MSGENGITKELVQKALEKCKDLDDGKTNLSPITDVLEMAEKECLTEREAQQILRRRSRIEAALAYALMELTDQEMGEEVWGKEWDHGTILRWMRKGEKEGIQGFVGSVLSVKRHELEGCQEAGHAVSTSLAYVMSHIDYEKCCFRETPLSIRETDALLLKLNPQSLREILAIFMNWAREETDRAKVLDQLSDENKSARAALRLIFAYIDGGMEGDPKEVVWEGTLLPANEDLPAETIRILNKIMRMNRQGKTSTDLVKKAMATALPCEDEATPLPSQQKTTDGRTLYDGKLSLRDEIRDHLRVLRGRVRQIDSETKMGDTDPGRELLVTEHRELVEIMDSAYNDEGDADRLQSTKDVCNRLQDENGKLKEKIQALGHVIADLQMDKEARE